VLSRLVGTTWVEAPILVMQSRILAKIHLYDYPTYRDIAGDSTYRSVW
jgi:hypothetical protein